MGLRLAFSGLDHFPHAALGPLYHLTTRFPPSFSKPLPFKSDILNLLPGDVH